MQLKTVGRENFERLFSVILADNGSEFSNSKAIEFGSNEKSRQRTYFFILIRAAYIKKVLLK